MIVADVLDSDLVRLIVAGGLGLLVGMERERHGAEAATPLPAGVRTHTLISMCGFASAWLFRHHVGFVIPAGIFAIAVWTGIAYIFKARQGHVGFTSEVAALLTFLTGALALLAPLWLAAALAVANTLVLSEKTLLEQHVALLDRNEFLAVVKFLIVSAIILPALPDRAFTTFALNPRHIWKIVVIVSTISFGGYVLARQLGPAVGFAVSALLGGLVSSTAVTIAAGRLACDNPSQANRALHATLLAGAVAYVRLLFLIWLVHPLAPGELWWQLSALALAGVALALGSSSRSAAQLPGALQLPRNPFDLIPAALFAAAFTLLTILTAVVRTTFGVTGLLVLSLLVGCTDITPFVLSLVHRGAPLDSYAIHAIILACMSNTLLRGVYLGLLVPGLRMRALWRHALWAAFHLPLILWV
ncbi:MAG: MgtC/SapB family protein [bacterium]|nr:MgtC/SapB family protein [bacterium]